GHVLTSVLQDKTEPVHKVSIIPRGFSGGATHYLLSDKNNYSRQYLEQILVTLMGGRAAEELVFNDLTTGAGNDIERCTDIAKKMICAWGMSDKIGPMTIGKDQGEVYLGKEILSRDIYSDDTAKLVDSEIRNLIHKSHSKALDLLKTHNELMDALAIKLLEVETLTTEEIFNTILDTVSDNLKPMIEKKFQQALELRFEYSAKKTESNIEGFHNVDTDEHKTSTNIEIEDDTYTSNDKDTS
ncbi:MAG: cell division protein FtsH, partial [Candidatus Cloacimonetes bacterium]|nr:cell division protein FtsH [Candidatus Cloacimonadota bacterium]